MSSQVNPSSINPSYPVPGVNQSSQGFRTNFLAIQNAFAQYVAEMNDVINKAIVSAPLTYGANTAVNNFGGMQNSNLGLFDYALTINQVGSLSSSQFLPLDFESGSVQQVTLTTANTVITPVITNFPGLGYSEMVLDITATAVPQYISLANLASSGNVWTNSNSGIAGYNATSGNITITSANIPVIVKLGSLDGQNWTLTQPNSSATARASAPPSSIGAPGDTLGMIAFGGATAPGNIYVCIKNYDGFSSIWAAAALSNI